MRVPWPRALVALGLALTLGSALVACGGATEDPTLPRVQQGLIYAPNLALDVYRPVRGIAPLKAVVLVHGGGFAEGGRADMANYAQAFATRGYVAVTIDYRLSQGQWFPAQTLDDPGLLQAVGLARTDTEEAVAWVRQHAYQYRVDPSRVAVIGYSAGGITALDVAAHDPDPVWATVSISGAATGPDLATLGNPHPPMLLVHGDLDDVIPESLALDTCNAAAPGGDCEIHPYAEVGHDVTLRFQDIVGVIDKYLTGLE